jgi:thiol:disulfide interchange protein DsbD
MVPIPAGNPQASAPPGRPVQAGQSSSTPLTFWAALLGALIGGMILNLMPCIVPGDQGGRVRQ